ncbi:UNVERIFIED_CONTAM: class D sortase [Halobacillus marinus]
MSARRITGGIFVLMGLILLSIPFLYEWKQNQKVQAMEEAMTLIESSDGEPVDLSEVDNLPVDEEQLKGMMELEIPSIGVKENILSETTEDNLNIALTQIKENQTPGEGNFTVAGHRGFRNGRFFNRLPDVPIGAEILLHDKENTFVYTVTSREVIAPTDVEVLNDHGSDKEITLITCTLNGEERVMLKGKYKEI